MDQSLSSDSQLRVLIIDDNYWQLELHQQLLEEAGFLVDTAVTIRTAWKKIHYQEPDIVILDRLLLDGDGIDMCQHIKAINPSIFIIMLSGYKNSETDRIDGLDAGADDYLGKPISPGEFLARVRAAARLRQTQINLQKSENNFRLLAHNVTDLIGRMTSDGRILYASPSCQEITGYAPDQVVGEHIWNWVHPDDRKIVDDLGQLDQGETLSKKLVLRINDKNGQYKWLEVALHGVAGKEELVFVARDIDERKKIENHLHLLSTALTATANAVIIFDKEGVIQWANPAFTALTGYTIDEALGRKLSWLGSGKHPETYFQQMWHTINSGQVWVGEIINRRKNGQEYVEKVTITPLVNAAGAVTQFIEIKQDVTEEKKAQQALQESEERLRTLIENLPDIVIRYDTQCRHVFISPNFEELSAIPIAACLGKTHSEIGYPPEMVLYWEEKIRQVLDTGEVFEDEFIYDQADRRLCFNWRLVPEYDVEGRITAVLGIAKDITAHKESEKEIARLAALVEQATEIELIVDENGTIVYSNPYYTTLTSEPTVNILQQPLKNFTTFVQNADLESNVQQVQDTGQPWRGQIAFQNPGKPLLYFDTDIIPISLANEPKRNAGILMRDITKSVELMREQAAIANTASALRQADSRADMLPIILNEIQKNLKADGAALVVPDPDGVPTIEMAVGNEPFTSGEWLSVYITQQAAMLPSHSPYVNNDFLAALNQSGEELLNPVKAVIGLPLTVQDHELGVLLIGRQAPFQNQEIKVLLAISDIAASALYRAVLLNHLKLQAQELAGRVEERTAALNIVNTQLTRALRSRDEFLASMSHELRTPLSSILLRTELMQKTIYGPLTEKQARSIEVIRSSGQHLLELINDILDVAKIEAGKLTLDITTLSIREICQASILLVQQLATEKQIDLSLEADEELGGMEADARRLKQILVNLLTNAVKFTPEQGQVRLCVEQESDGDLITFTVSDTGIGIPGEELPKLFKPFVQLDSSLSRKYEGTGLGLSLVKYLVDLHGGGVQITSVVNQGTKVTFRLPRYGGEKMSVENNPSGEFNEGEQFMLPPKKHMKVVLAEDNQYTIEALSEYLVSIGYEVYLAANGLEALQKIREVLPNLVIMDIQMPDMDGLEAIRRIRGNGVLTAMVPILALTALAMPGDKERCLEAGASAYLTKPFALDTFTTLLHSLTGETDHKGFEH